MPVLLAALGALVISLDSTVNIAFPAMSAHFGVGPTAIRWVIICYVLTYALTSFAAGILADRVGPGRVFAAGLWLSAATFLGYVAVPGFGALLAARVAQGLGGGLVYGTAPALVTLSLPRERHGRGLGTMAAGLGIGLAVGPLIGGALVSLLGWRAVFVFRAPLAAAAALLAGSRLGAGGGGGSWHLPRAADVLAWPVGGALLLALLANGAQFAVWLLVPFYLVEVRGMSAAAGGLAFMLTPLGTALAAPIAGRITDRVGGRWPMVLGLAVEAAGLAGIAGFTAETAPPRLAACLALVGAGVGLFQVPNLARVMAAFPDARQGAAGGLAFMVRTLGVVAGVQASSMLFAAGRDGGGFLAGFSTAFLWMAVVCAVAVLIALVPERPGRGPWGPRYDP